MWCQARSVYIASDKIMERLVRGARHDFLEGHLNSITRDLPVDTRAKLEASLFEPMRPTGFHRLKDDVGAASLESVLGACDRLAFVEGLELPAERLGGVDPAWVDLLSRRVEGETASEMLRRHAEAVTDALFQQYDFFDSRDLLQVKYEMLRRVEAEGHFVTAAAAAFVLSRSSFYEARTAWQREGLAGLLPKKRGPRRGHKLTPEVVAFLERRRAEDAHVSAASLVREVKQRFGARVHPRSVERALRRQEINLP